METQAERNRRRARADELRKRREEAGAKAARVGKAPVAPYKSFVARVAWEAGYRSVRPN
jgi:hypothetical protein